MRFPLRKAIPAAVHLGAAVVLPHFSSLGAGPAPARIERTAAEYVALAHEAGLEVGDVGARAGGGRAAARRGRGLPDRRPRRREHWTLRRPAPAAAPRIR